MGVSFSSTLQTESNQYCTQFNILCLFSSTFTSGFFWPCALRMSLKSILAFQNFLALEINSSIQGVGENNVWKRFSSVFHCSNQRRERSKYFKLEIFQIPNFDQFLQNFLMLFPGWYLYRVIFWDHTIFKQKRFMKFELSYSDNFTKEGFSIAARLPLPSILHGAASWSLNRWPLFIKYSFKWIGNRRNKKDHNKQNPWKIQNLMATSPSD